MRSETRSVLLAFFRDPTAVTYAAIEVHSVDTAAQMALFRSGKAEDQELFDAFFNALVDSTRDDVRSQFIKAFMDRFYDRDWRRVLLPSEPVSRGKVSPPLRLVAASPRPDAIDDAEHLFVSPEDFTYAERHQAPDETGD